MIVAVRMLAVVVMVVMVAVVMFATGHMALLDSDIKIAI
ncbi:putative membrane protein [Collimonas arenae]|uniref:Putative membrane protein n=1 Tax=Collimonas arenae TaxID=279058 RepID=A0A127QLV3_9BURK|nr:putative membrane protein [Collimonas arenae]